MRLEAQSELCHRVPTPETQEEPSPGAHEPRHRWYLRDNGKLLEHSDRVLAFRKRYFPKVSWREWNDWHWQAAHRIRTAEQLQSYLCLGAEETGALVGNTMLPFSITPYYLALIDAKDSHQGLRRTVVPNHSELTRNAGESDDPLAEESHAVVPGLVHRYPDRVLFLATDHCATYCRYCTRSRVVGSNELTAKIERWKPALDYIRAHTEIRDVLISGGDPLTMSDDKLDWLLTELRGIRHVEFLRIGSKVPAVMPQRVTKGLVKVLRRHHPLWMSLHFVHPDECTPESLAACARLADAGIPLGSQTVLLKGVNDNVGTLRRLLHRLLVMRVRPYYLYQCDPISGSQHLRTPVDQGIALIEQLRGYTSGYALPTYVIDAPGGGGKIPLNPEYVLGHDSQGVVLRNFENRVFHYPDPESAVTALPSERPAARSRMHLRTVP